MIDSFIFFYQGIVKRFLQSTQIFYNQKNPVKCSACIVHQKVVIECGRAFLEVHLFPKNPLLEVFEMLHENIWGNK